MADEKALDIETKHTNTEPHEPKLDVPLVTWWKEPGLRHLYLMMPILFLGSTINGYDGSLLNGLQTMEQWRSYFGQPTGAQLGPSLQSRMSVLSALYLSLPTLRISSAVALASKSASPSSSLE